MNWIVLIREWRHVLKLERKRMTWRSWLAMLRALWSGPVPDVVYQERLKTCGRCLLYDVDNKRCRSTRRGFEHLGCGCAVRVLAMTAAPYPKGCYGRELLPDLGWPAHEFVSRRQRRAAIYGFLLHPFSHFS